MDGNPEDQRSSSGGMPYCPQCGSEVSHEQLTLESDDEEATEQRAHVQCDVDSIPVGGLQQPISLPKSVGVGEAEAGSERSSSPPSPKSSDASGEPKQRQPKMLPSALRRNASRLMVRKAMLAAIPGINRARAEAIVDKYPSLRALMNATERELAALTIKKGPLGNELAVAILRVLS